MRRPTRGVSNDPRGGGKARADPLVVKCLFAASMLPSGTRFVTIPVTSHDRARGAIRLPPEVPESAPRYFYLGALDKWGLCDDRALRLVPDLDTDLGPGGRHTRIEVRKRDSDAQGWRHHAARHDADISLARQDPAPMPGDAAIRESEPEQATVVASLLLQPERLAPDELVVPLHEPLAVRLEARLPTREILAREEVALLEPERVPRAEPAGPYADVRARVQEGGPDGDGERRRREEVEGRGGRGCCGG